MNTRNLSLLTTCLFLSGLAGLIYQTAWTQQLALVFGTSELALVTVLAAYMGGLALGAALAARWVDRVRRPILVYGLLELGIGLAALAVPAAIAAAGRLHAALLGGAELPPDAGSAASALFYLATSFSILLVPTALMGATLPLLARPAVRREAEIGSRIALLYTANTAGAAAGTLATAFLLLPRIGLGQTILVAVATNLLVFALAALLARGTAAPARVPIGPRPRRDAGIPWILPAVMVSGAVSFSWEILWSRLLTPLLGGSVYAFATMLASFLVALSLGSALAAPLASSQQRARLGFAAAQLAIALLSLAAFAAADRLPALIRQWAGAARTAPDDGSVITSTGLDEALLGGSVLGAALLLPGALAIGATFPFAVRVLAREAREAATASARVFAWNTVGAIAGALLTGYIALPALRFAGTAAVASALSLSLAAIAALGVRPRRPLLGAAALASLLALVWVRPATPWEVVRHSYLAAQPVPGRVVHFGVGRSATVLLVERHAEWRLSTNGLPESSIESSLHHPGRHVLARWLSLLPLAARPEARSLLAVGLGAGVTLEAVPGSVETLHVVELEPEVVAANRRVAAERRSDPLADPRLTLHLNDARGALRLTARRFDAIVSQPSHPWTSGASNLYTREFFSLARERLTPDGVFVQWMGIPFVDESLLRSLVATVADVFPYVEVYQPRPGAVLFLGSAQPLEVARNVARSLATAGREWSQLGVHCPEDVLVARWLDSEGARRLRRDAALITDSRNLLRMRSPRVLRRALDAAGADRIFAPFDPLLAPGATGDPLYLVRRLIRQRALRRARRLAETLTDLVAKQTALGLVELAIGRRRPAETALRRALRLDATNREALAALVLLYRAAIARGQPAPFPERLDPELRAVVEGWRLIDAGDWRGVRRLEPRLAELELRHPLFDAAVRLRARWRIESKERNRAGEALDLLSPLLAPVARPGDLLLRARAGAAAGAPRIALAATGDALGGVRRQPAMRGAVLAEARRILESLPAETAELESWRAELLEVSGSPELPAPPRTATSNRPGAS